MCILGEPTECKLVLGHFGSLWPRISTQGPFIHTAFSEAGAAKTRPCGMREVIDAVLEWIPSWEDDPENSYRGAKAIVNVGAIDGGFGWRVSRRRTARICSSTCVYRRRSRCPQPAVRCSTSVGGFVAASPTTASRREVYVTAPGAEIDEDHLARRRVDESHAAVFGAAPGRDVTRWFSDASVLARVRDRDLNYGTSSGLPRPSAARISTSTGSSRRRASTRSRRHATAESRAEPLRAAAGSARPSRTTACDHLPGEPVPQLVLESSQGRWISRARRRARRALRLSVGAIQGGRASPRRDAIPGARGCTPQSCAFRDHAGGARRAGRPCRRGSRRSRSRTRVEVAERLACPMR